jgi:hypothetical protein
VCYSDLQLRQVRAAFATDQQNRTELEGFLAQCVQDVRQEIGRRRQSDSASRHGRPSSAASVGGAGGGRQPGYSDFDESDRSKVMEMLLSQERVRLFPALGLPALFHRCHAAFQCKTTAAVTLSLGEWQTD